MASNCPERNCPQRKCPMARNKCNNNEEQGCGSWKMSFPQCGIQAEECMPEEECNGGSEADVCCCEEEETVDEQSPCTDTCNECCTEGDSNSDSACCGQDNSDISGITEGSDQCQCYPECPCGPDEEWVNPDIKPIASPKSRAATQPRACSQSQCASPSYASSQQRSVPSSYVSSQSRTSPSPYTQSQSRSAPSAYSNSLPRAVPCPCNQARPSSQQSSSPGLFKGMSSKPLRSQPFQSNVKTVTVPRGALNSSTLRRPNMCQARPTNKAPAQRAGCGCITKVSVPKITGDQKKDVEAKLTFEKIKKIELDSVLDRNVHDLSLDTPDRDPELIATLMNTFRVDNDPTIIYNTLVHPIGRSKLCATDVHHTDPGSLVPKQIPVGHINQLSAEVLDELEAIFKSSGIAYPSDDLATNETRGLDVTEREPEKPKLKPIPPPSLFKCALELQPLRIENFFQLRGTNSPAWYPGLMASFPDGSSDVHVIKTPSGLIKTAYKFCKP